MPKMSDTIQLRPMTAPEVEQLVGWAASEGWNPGLDDSRSFFEVDPDGFMAAEINGEMIGGGAIIRHHASFGFMGLFIVRADYRGHGIGRTLWYARRDRLASRLGPGGTIGMDAVPAMREFYARGEFRESGLSVRFRLDRTAPAQDDSFRTVPVSAIPKEQLAEFDRSCFPSPRDRYLRVWVAQPHSRSFAAVANGVLRGYAVARQCGTGWKVGPLFADHRDVACGLFRSCWEAAQGTPVFLDIPEGNPQAIAMANEFGMVPGFSCMRMYRGPEPAVKPDRIFGVTSFELG
jgi:GNAT superfamily N-acetyltransferase